MQKLSGICSTLDLVIHSKQLEDDSGFQPLKNLLRQAAIECEHAELACSLKAEELERQHASGPHYHTLVGTSLNPRPYKAYTTIGSLPGGLTFAVLDDSILISRNVIRIVRKYLAANHQSFSLGATLCECRRFVEQVMTRQPDVIILDENLEYDDESTISGSEIAVKIRELGYTGCLIRYSSQSEPPLHKPEVFDGLITKTSDRERFVTDVIQAWEHHVAYPCSAS